MMRRGELAGTLLMRPAFGLFWAGETVSGIGNMMATVAMPLVMVVVLHASTLAVGLLTTVMYLPWLVVSLPAGVVVDRLPLRRSMVITDLVEAALFAGIPVAVWLHVLNVAVVFAVAFLTGAANVFFTTAYQALVPSLVRRDELVTANAWLTGSASTAQLAGPGLSGLVAGSLGVIYALLLNSASFLVSAACLLGTRRRPAPETRSVPARPGRSLGRDIADGIRFVSRDRYLRPLTLWAAVVNIGLAGSDALLVLFLIRVVHVGPGTVGFLFTLTGIGSIGGALAAKGVVSRLGSARAMFLAGAFLTPFALLIPLAGPGTGLVFLVAGRAVAFAGIVVANVIVASFRQSYAPPEMLGTVIATTRFVLMGAYPAGAAIGGVLGTWLGIRPALWITFGAVAVAGACLFTPSIRGRRDLPVAGEPRETGLSRAGSRRSAPRPGRAGPGCAAWPGRRAGYRAGR
jgi:predicted MFS family arabinose efflux permease